jgi:hypothetical protein
MGLKSIYKIIIEINLKNIFYFKFLLDIYTLKQSKNIKKKKTKQKKSKFLKGTVGS